MRAPQYRRYSDGELLAAEFRIEDPLSIEGLCNERPDPELVPEILGEYDRTPPGGRRANPDEPWLWCCHCQGARHWRGFVITNATGARFMIGSRCGLKHYEASFKGSHNIYREQASRKGILERFHDLLRRAPALNETADEILSSPALRILDDKRAELKAASGDAFARLEAAARNGSALEDHVQVRDVAAERERDERMERDRVPPSKRSSEPIYTTERRSLGRIEGEALVIERGDARDLLLKLKRALAELDRLERADTNDASLAQLTKAVRDAEEALRDARLRLASCRRANLFFSDSNARRLERWSAHHRTFNIHADEDGLRITARGERPLLISPLPLLDVPFLPAD